MEESVSNGSRSGSAGDPVVPESYGGPCGPPDALLGLGDRAQVALPSLRRARGLRRHRLEYGEQRQAVMVGVRLGVKLGEMLHEMVAVKLYALAVSHRVTCSP